MAVAAVLDPRQTTLYQAWCRQAAQCAGVPPRSAFDPVEFPGVLPTLAIYEFIAGGKVRIRLVGTEIVRAWGSDNTGRCLDEIMQGDYHDFIRGQIDRCARERVPIYSRSRFRWDRGRALDTRRLLLPYAREDRPEEVGFVLLSQVFDYGKTGPSLPLVRLGKGFDFVELEEHSLPTDGD